MPQSRQLAAIMFTDIVGYTALMGNDEQKAFELFNKIETFKYLNTAPEEKQNLHFTFKYHSGWDLLRPGS